MPYVYMGPALCKGCPAGHNKNRSYRQPLSTSRSARASQVYLCVVQIQLHCVIKHTKGFQAPTLRMLCPALLPLINQETPAANAQYHIAFADLQELQSALQMVQHQQMVQYRRSWRRIWLHFPSPSQRPCNLSFRVLLQCSTSLRHARLSAGR